MMSSMHARAPDAQDNPLTQILENALGELRTLTACKICVRPMYEPYTIKCGHTFCYSCLGSWFERHRHDKSCPTCRSKVTEQPAPAFLVCLYSATSFVIAVHARLIHCIFCLRGTEMFRLLMRLPQSLEIVMLTSRTLGARVGADLCYPS